MADSIFYFQYGTKPWCTGNVLKMVPVHYANITHNCTPQQVNVKFPVHHRLVFNLEQIKYFTPGCVSKA